MDTTEQPRKGACTQKGKSCLLWFYKNAIQCTKYGFCFSLIDG